jgi:hypothetical protein
VEAVDPSPAPIPFRFTGPAGHPLAPDTLERMTKAMTEERLGLLAVRLPGGATATLARTEALNRARLLADPGRPLDAVIEATHGVRHAGAAEFWTEGKESMEAPAEAEASRGWRDRLKSRR